MPRRLVYARCGGNFTCDLTADHTSDAPPSQVTPTKA